MTPKRFRFTATDGRLLAALVGDTIDHAAGSTDVLLDCDQFSSALKALTKGAAAASGQPVRVVIDVGEVRFTRGMTSALVRRVPLTYPVLDHVFTKPGGLRWVACAASLDQTLAALARKISGKATLLFVTPVPIDSPASRLWKPLSADGTPEVARIADLQSLVRGPAYWSDRELMILLMPVTRAAEEPQLDLSGFVLPVAQAAAVAA